MVEVEDTGLGIAAADPPFVGNAFFRAGVSKVQRCDGTGLGLSIVQDLVRRHGGEVEMSSRAGEGTRARVRMPIAPANTAARRGNVDQRGRSVGSTLATARCASGG